MKTYLMNSPILTAHGTWVFWELTDDESRRTVKNSEIVVSAIGHASSALVLGRILNINVKVCRQTIRMEPGDRAIVLRITKRMPEGAILDYAELEAWPHELGLLERRS